MTDAASSSSTSSSSPGPTGSAGATSASAGSAGATSASTGSPGATSAATGSAVSAGPVPARDPQRPWRGVLVATTVPFREDGSLDLDRYAEHVAWLAAEGCDGVVPNGSLGEYQTLTADERAGVV